MASATDIFFKLGDKVTGGDPQRQADFTYYMLWILFTAFLSMFCLNTFRLITTGDPNYAIWAAIGFAITSLQFFSLKQMYELRKLRRVPQEPMKVESFDEMMEGFETKNNEKEETQKNVRKTNKEERSS